MHETLTLQAVPTNRMLETLADGVAEARVTCRALQVLRREALEAAVVADGAVLEGIL